MSNSQRHLLIGLMRSKMLIMILCVLCTTRETREGWPLLTVKTEENGGLIEYI
jgi:hypothetical protein